ncbi:MAG: hypothetical protein JOZ03_04535 [Gammaproteobacteria bacterium]|nr:hypothetical protein [Gammaproteobacteria bacterium]
MRALVLLFSIIIAPAALAGAILKVDRKDSAGKTVPHEVYYAQDGMLRIDSVDEHGTVGSFDVVRDGVIWRVDLRNRTFTRVDADTMKQMMGGNSSQLQAALANLPPERRAALQARLSQMQQHGGASDYVFTDTGRSEQAGQYSCRVWTETHNGKPFAEYCVVATSSLPAGSELADAMKKAYATASQVLAGVPLAARQAERLTRMEKMNGFPARRRSLGSSGQAEDENVLESAQSQQLPADKFAIPKGFTEKPLGEHGGD